MPNIDESHCDLVSLRTVKAGGCAGQERSITAAAPQHFGEFNAEALAVSSDEALR